MANNAGMSYNFKAEILRGTHDLDAAGSQSFKMALYTSGGSIGPGTPTYTTASELAASGDYVAGGKLVTKGSVSAITMASAIWTPSSLSWTGITYSNLDCALLYNTGNSKCVASFTFSAQSSSGGNFTLTMPTNAIGTALIQIT